MFLTKACSRHVAIADHSYRLAIEAQRIVSTIVEEYDLDNGIILKYIIICLTSHIEQKTIKKTDFGGKAGGDKYYDKGFFVKFALDSEGIYGGNHNLAAKAV